MAELNEMVQYAITCGNQFRSVSFKPSPHQGCQQPTQPHQHQGLQLARYQRTHPQNPYFMTCSRPMSNSAIAYPNNVPSQPLQLSMASPNPALLSSIPSTSWNPPFLPSCIPASSAKWYFPFHPLASIPILICPFFHRPSTPTFVARSNVKPANTWSN